MADTQTEKRDTNRRKTLVVGLKFDLALSYLATGIAPRDAQWHVGYSTVSKVVFEVCNAIVTEFQIKCSRLQPMGSPAR